jgi:type IV pilus assembly protein PilE
MNDGFSLIEIMITLTIIGVLLIIALPIYSQHTIHANRMTAEIALTKVAAALEQQYITTQSYKDMTLDKLHIVTPKQYQLKITSTTDSTFTLTANPLAEQAKNDKACAALTLNSNGEKGITGFGTIEECW